MKNKDLFLFKLQRFIIIIGIIVVTISYFEIDIYGTDQIIKYVDNIIHRLYTLFL